MPAQGADRVPASLPAPVHGRILGSSSWEVAPLPLSQLSCPLPPLRCQPLQPPRPGPSAPQLCGRCTYFPPQKILVVITRLERLWAEKEVITGSGVPLFSVSHRGLKSGTGSWGCFLANRFQGLGGTPRRHRGGPRRNGTIPQTQKTSAGGAPTGWGQGGTVGAFRDSDSAPREVTSSLSS